MKRLVRLVPWLVFAFVVILGCPFAYALPAPTSTTLVITVSGVAVPVVPAKTAVVLTAKVLFNSTSVFQGQVDFCNANTPSCTDINLLGTAQVTSAGTATLRFVPGPGTHLYRAIFRGTQVYGRSTSGTASLQVLAATGPLDNTVGIQAKGGQGNYSLLGTVATNAPNSPTGAVSFLDTDNANYSFGSANLASTGAAGITFRNASNNTFAEGGGDYGNIVVADFNGDGIPDIAVLADYKSITVLFGRGDGTFTRSTVATAAPDPSNGFDNLYSADFNGDGYADLLATDSAGLHVFLGHGDGTFTALPAAMLQISQLQRFIGIGDFNGDGVVDFATQPNSGAPGGNQIYIYLGNGDGTFTLKTQPAPLVANGFAFAAVGDFNGDGLADLAITGASSGAFEILLSNGDGTFRQGASALYEDDYEFFITCGDVNRDGKLDIILHGAGYSPLPNAGPTIVYLGNGDGTFTKLPIDPNLTQYAETLILADFNGDGIPDLVLPNQEGGYTSVFVGRGDGTFIPDTYSPTFADVEVFGSAIADFNGDGQSDIAQVIDGLPNPDNYPTTVSILLAQSPNTTAGYLYNVSPVGTGIHNVIASYPGDANNGAGVSHPVALIAQQVTTVLSLSVSPSAGSATGQPVTLSASLNTHFAQNHEATGLVTFTSNGTSIGSASVSNGSASLTTTALVAGTDILKASYAGDVNFLGSVTASASYKVDPRSAQTITFPPPATPAYAGTSVQLTATASSGLAVTYSVVSGPAYISALNGTVLTYTGAGTVVVEADQAGSNGYAAAAPVQQSIAVSLLTVPIGQSASFGTVMVASTAGTVRTTSALTQGQPNTDFHLLTAGSRGCTGSGPLTLGEACTVGVTFSPTSPGKRNGAIVLSDGSGKVLTQSAVFGIGVGPQVSWSPGALKTLLSKVTESYYQGIALDGSGNLFFSTQQGLMELASGSSTPVMINSTASPGGIAVDGSGNLFVSYPYSIGIYGTLVELVAATGYTTVIPLRASCVYNPEGVALDGNGNLFTADQFNGAVCELMASSGYTQSTLIPTNFGQYAGPITVDANGNLFVARNSTNGYVEELTAASGYTNAITIANGLEDASGLALDANGNLYVTAASFTHQTLQLLVFNAASQYKTNVVLFPNVIFSGLALDGQGNVYLQDPHDLTISMLDVSTPPSLTFAATPVGTTSSDSPQSVTLVNNGNAPLVLGSTSYASPSITAGFSFTSTCPIVPAASTTTYVVAAGATCTDAVSFTPTISGPQSGQLTTTDNNLNAAPATQIVTLDGTGTTNAPSLTFAVPNHTFGDPPFTVSASSSSPGTITYSVVSGPAIIAGSTLTLTGAGTVTLQANQTANGSYAAATQMASFNVAKAPQTITFPAPATPLNFASTPIALSASASSGLPVSFSIVSGPGTVSGNTLSLTGLGTIVVAGIQAGNPNYLPASTVTRSVVVVGRSDSLSLQASPNPVFISNPLTLTSTLSATGGSPSGSVRFLDGPNPIGTGTLVNGTAILKTSSLSIGTHVITAIYDGDGTFVQAISNAVNVTVEDFSLSVTNPNVTIDHGGAGIFHIVVASMQNAGMASTIIMSVSGAPDRSVVTFSPSTIPSGSGTTNVTMTVQTPNYPTGPWGSLKTSSGVSLGFLSFGALLFSFRRHRGFGSTATRLITGALLCLASLGTMEALTGCGSGWRTQGWTMTVSATSGALSRTASATLTSKCANGQPACPVE